MIIRKVDTDNDWRFGKGNSDYARDEQALEENLKTRLQSWVGDCFFALNDGIDWNARMDVGQQAALTEECRNLILQTEGIVGINAILIEFEPGTRAAVITYNVDTVFSQSFQRQIQLSSGT